MPQPDSIAVKRAKIKRLREKWLEKLAQLDQRDAELCMEQKAASEQAMNVAYDALGVVTEKDADDIIKGK